MIVSWPREPRLRQRSRKLESWRLPDDVDYSGIHGLRHEARQKLQAFRPVTLGQASRIDGVNPADVAVLLVFLQRLRRRGEQQPATSPDREW